MLASISSWIPWYLPYAYKTQSPYSTILWLRTLVNKITYQDAYYLENKRQQMLTKVWRKWNLCTLLVIIQHRATTIENSINFPQKIKNRTNLWSVIHLLVFIQRDWNQDLEEMLALLCSLENYSQQRAGGNNLNVLWWENGRRKEIGVGEVCL